MDSCNSQKGIAPPREKSGFASILIAVGIVSTLAAMSLVSALAAGINNRRIASKIDRVEAFYSNELVAWHSYIRSNDNLTAISPFTVENRYTADLNLAADSYDATPGAALNVATTKTFSPSANLIRRYEDGALTYQVPSGIHRGYCGSTRFGGKKQKYQTCLAGPTNRAKLAYIARISAAGTSSYIGLDRAGSIVSDFGSNGTLMVNGLGGSSPMNTLASWTRDKILFDLLVSIQNNSQGFMGSGITLQGKPSDRVGIGGQFHLTDYVGAPSHLDPIDDGILITIGKNFGILDVPVESVIVKYRLSGEVDTSFGEQGNLRYQFDGKQGNIQYGFGLAQQKILAIGAAERLYASDTIVARYDKFGVIDPDFNGMGFAKIHGWVRFIDRDAAGGFALILQRRVDNQDASESRFLRLTGNGELDPSFPADGRLIISSFETGGWCNTDSGGGIICGNQALETASFQRVLPTGEIDMGFGENGKAEITLGGVSDCMAFAVKPSRDRLPTLCCAGMMGRSTFYRLNISGKLDPTFGNQGKLGPFEGFLSVAPVLVDVPVE